MRAVTARDRHVQRVDDTRDVTQNGQQNVDEEVGTKASLEEDAERRENDGKNDLADVARMPVSASSSRLPRSRRAVSADPTEKDSRCGERHFEDFGGDR